MLNIPKQLFYTVRPGDTVYQIAKRWELPVESVIAANNLELPYTLYVGQQLSIPSGVNRYRVRLGDSVSVIAQLYGIPVSAIIEANQLKAPFMIYPDQFLYIPPGVPYYIVQPGDTLFLIALRYNVVTSRHSFPELIRDINKLPSFDIHPGMQLIIPYGPPENGGLLAYTSDLGGHFDLWVYNPRSGVHKQLTNGLADADTTPYWSGDSKKIAFVGKNRIVHVYELATGEIVKIDQLPEGEVATLDWSKDNQRIAYTKENNIIIYHLASHQVKRLNQIGVRDVQWFPNGKELLFQALDSNGLSQLYRINIDGSGKQQLTRNVNGPLNYVRLSPDGRFALYTSPGASISIIYTLDLANGQQFEIKGGPLAKNYFPEWSPDSLQVIYSATELNERGYYSFIHTVDRSGENDRKWAVSDCFAAPASWLPNGRKVVYLSGCLDQAYSSEIWYLDFNHPAPKKLLKGGKITSLKWSPKAITNPKKTYTNPNFKVRFRYPSNWQMINQDRYEGEDGFFQVSAISSESSISEVCHNEAFHSLLPYGTQPKILHTFIQHQAACFIFPSEDQPPEMKNQAALIIRYPKPLEIAGSKYQYLILWASAKHIFILSKHFKFI